ncbi:MAG TPA: hypothetical protein VJT49_15290 [Amycolatopsis sp.]|uniref:hypothetical protein n=1 Tax=Amycolatopsis sp. TaxID=37632 RepID=UPI002B49DFC6|nr:hypothetical protein [Amycolatopsis sp.]HKS46443.1 hypothetical protein [Amycolatopsis sp.]
MTSTSERPGETSEFPRTCRDARRGTNDRAVRAGGRARRLGLAAARQQAAMDVLVQMTAPLRHQTPLGTLSATRPCGTR